MASNAASDWQEAREEFFQETYPSESLTSNASTEVRRHHEPRVPNASSFRDASVGTLESRSSRVSNVHLNRTASTTPADAISSPASNDNHETPSSVNGPSSPKLGTNRNAKARMRAAVQGLEEEESDEGEIEVVDFTDENLATEVESWQNQKRLRDLALPLGQKKSLRLQYEKCPKIKLNRARAMGFACRRFGHWLCCLRAALCRRLINWSKPLGCIDRHRGGEMFAALQLHKILAFIIFIVALTMLSFMLLPYMLFMCDFSWERCKLPTDGNLTTIDLMGFFQNHPTYFYYSFFVNKSGLYSFEDYFPLLYLTVNLCCQLGISLYLFRQLVNLIRGITWDETADTWFKNVFASWNHNMVCQTSSTLKHRSIYRQIKQKVHLARSPTKAKTFCTRCLVVAARCLSLLLTLALWACIMGLIHKATLLQTQQKIDDFVPFEIPLSGPWRIAAQMTAFFLPVIFIILIRILVLPLAAILDKWEYYPFNGRVIAYSIRIFVSRSVSIFTLVTTLFHQHKGSCWEDHLCHQLSFLVLADGVADLILTLILRFPRVLLASLFKRRWSCSTKLNYDPYESVVDLVMDLTVLVLGLLYCPVLPFLAGAKLLVGYGLRLFHVWVNCSASRDTHSPSCIRFIFVGFSSVMILFSNVVLVYAVFFNPASQECGPFRGHRHIAEVVPETCHRIFTTGNQTSIEPFYMPEELDGGSLSKAAVAAYILASLIAVLLFGLYISHLKRLSIERDANELKCQLAIATQEKCYLISKIKKTDKLHTAIPT